MKPQVDRAHYDFRSYMTKGRWASIWTQLTTISELTPGTILEIGPGVGMLKAIGSLHGIKITTIDLDPALEPDHVGSIVDLPFDDNAFDMVCAFQVLEHLEYGSALLALREMKRVSTRHVLISLPNAQIVWRYRFYLPKLGERDLMFARPFWKPVLHKFEGEHYWELNKKDYELEKFIADLSAEFNIERCWRLWENPYHHFFLLESKG